MQSEIFRKQHESCKLWLRQNLTPRNTASVMALLEQMVETKSWKASGGLAGYVWPTKGNGRTSFG